MPIVAVAPSAETRPFRRHFWLPRNLESAATKAHVSRIVNNRKEVIQCLIAIRRVPCLRPGSSSPPLRGRLPEPCLGRQRLQQWEGPGGDAGAFRISGGRLPSTDEHHP